MAACGGSGGSGGSSGNGGGGGFGLSDLGQLQILIADTPAASPQSAGPLEFDKGAVADGGRLQRNFSVRNAASAGDITVEEIQLSYTAPDGATETDGPALRIISASLDGESIAVDAGIVRNVTVGPSAKLDVTVEYIRYPDTLERAGFVSIISDNVADSEKNVGFLVNVGAAFPIALITPTVVEFPQVAAGETKTRELKIANTGGAPLEIRKFSFVNTHPDFALLYSDATSGSTEIWKPADVDEHVFDPAIVIAPAGSVTFNVQFTPEGPDPAQGSVIFETNEAIPQQTVTLLANANRPCIEVVPSSVQFGAKLVGQTAVLPVVVKSCGNKDLQITGVDLTENVTGNYALNFEAFPGAAAPSADAAITIPIGQEATFTVQYTPAVESPLGEDGKPVLDAATITITSNAFETTTIVPVTGIGSNVVCPTAVGKILEGEQVIPQTTLHLQSDASFAPAGDISKREWSVAQPPGSASVFVPSKNFPNPTFETNVAGTYVFSLDVWDENNAKSCVPWEQTVLVVPDEAIHVELVWNTPNDPDETDEGPEAGSDVDLHFVHTKYAVGSNFDGDKDGKDDPWFHQPYDCFWFNNKPNWGTFDPTADDDPSLDRDDTDGAGPENLNLNVPQAGVTYGVGVHYWSDHEFGDAYATVRIYIYSNLVFEVKDVRLSNLDMWDVATIEWPSAAVKLVQKSGDQYKITPAYQNPYFTP